MITQKIHKIKISKTEAEKMAAYKTQGAVYDELIGELSFEVKHISKENFRLIHNNVTAWVIIKGTNKSTTLTIFEAEKFQTEQQALDQIAKLGLEYNPEELEIKAI